jgi:salicylate hydroxylase
MGPATPPGPTNHASEPSNLSPSISIAIIGAGLIGSILSLGLLRRKIGTVTIYEQSTGAAETGAGIAFTSNARECLTRIDPRLSDCVTAVATVNGEDAARPNWNMQFADGYTRDRNDNTVHEGGEGQVVGGDMEGKKVWRLWAGERGFEGCHRKEFLERVLELVAEDVVRFGKRLRGYELPGKEDREGRIRLVFEDGEVDEADIGMYPLYYTLGPPSSSQNRANG